MRWSTRWQNSGCAISRCRPRRTRYGEPSTGGEVRLTLLLYACLIAITAAAQSYPRGPARMIVPFPAGGGVDVAGRALAQALTASAGKPSAIEDRGGARGAPGPGRLARARAAAHALLLP